MKFEVSETDYKMHVAVLNLLNRGGYNVSITREDIVRESGLSSSLMSYKIKNSYLKEQLLKERIA